MDVGDIETGQLGVADSAAVQQFKDDGIARGPCRRCDGFGIVGLGTESMESITRIICSIEGTRADA